MCIFLFCVLCQLPSRKLLHFLLHDWGCSLELQYKSSILYLLTSAFHSVFFNFSIEKNHQCKAFLWEKWSWLKEFNWIVIYCQLHEPLISDLVLRYNEHNKLNKYVGKIVFLLCLPQPRFRHLSSPFLVSIPFAFATHYTQSLQRWWTAQEEGINE